MMKSIRNIINYYLSDMKLKNKLLISHLIVVLIPSIVLSVIFSMNFYDVVVDNAIASEEALSIQTSNTLEATLSQVIYSANAVKEAPLTEAVFDVKKIEAGIHSLDETSMINYHDFLSMVTEDELITDVRIYYAEPFSAMKYNNIYGKPFFESIDNIASTYWYGIFEATEIDELFCPSLYLSPGEVRDNGELAYIARIPYKDSYNETAAYVAVYFSEAHISSILEQNITVNGSVSYLINSRSSIVAASDEVLVGAYGITYEQLKTAQNQENVFETDAFMGENLYFGYHNIDDSDWYMVTVIPADEISEKGLVLLWRVIALYFLFVFVALWIAITLSRSIAKRISTVIHQMENVHFGHPQHITEMKISKDEIGELVDTYNYMTDEIHLLLKKQEQAAKEMRLVEFEALQSQINPHFLYNSLDMINWLAQGGKKEDAGRAIQALSKFYKLTLSRKNKEGSLEKELEHVTLYVQLQNMRYDDSIDLLIDIAPEMKECAMPRLTLQPIVENAIIHGIMMKPEKCGTIVITGWREDKDVVILVSDDGVGISKQELSGILTGEKKPKKGNNIGVYNTHRRLQIIYGEEYGLFYNSEVGVGTEVMIRISQDGVNYE